MAITYEKSEQIRESFRAIANLYEDYTLRMAEAAKVAIKIAIAMEVHAQWIKDLGLDQRPQTPDQSLES